jgi:predicted GNAT family N-acyltransferase
MRMAVEEGMRGRAIGRRLVERAESVLCSTGTEVLMMHARCTAVAFYEKCGYARVGEEFLEQGIPHVRMEKRLRGWAGSGPRR